MSTCKNTGNEFKVEDINLNKNMVILKNHKGHVPAHCLEVMLTSRGSKFYTINRVKGDNGDTLADVIVSKPRAMSLKRVNAALDIAVANDSEIGISAGKAFRNVKNDNRLSIYVLDGATASDQDIIDLCVPAHGESSAFVTDGITDNDVRTEGVVRLQSTMNLAVLGERTNEAYEEIWAKIELLSSPRSFAGTYDAPSLKFLRVTPNFTATCQKTVLMDVTQDFQDEGKTDAGYLADVQFFDCTDNYNFGGVHMASPEVVLGRATSLRTGIVSVLDAEGSITDDEDALAIALVADPRNDELVKALRKTIRAGIKSKLGLMKTVANRIGQASYDLIKLNDIITELSPVAPTEEATLQGRIETAIAALIAQREADAAAAQAQAEADAAQAAADAAAAEADDAGSQT